VTEEGQASGGVGEGSSTAGQGGWVVIPGLKVVKVVTVTTDTVTKPGASVSGYITVITTTTVIKTTVYYPDGRSTTTTTTTTAVGTRPATQEEIPSALGGAVPDSTISESVITTITNPDGTNSTTFSGDPLPDSVRPSIITGGDAAHGGAHADGTEVDGGDESQMISVTDEVLDMLANPDAGQTDVSDITDAEVSEGGGQTHEENLIDGDSTDSESSNSSTDSSTDSSTESSSSSSTSTSTSTSTQVLLGPGACLFDGKVYVSAQQIPRDNPCDFCFCFRGDIICLQQSCPPPVPGCAEQPIEGFCCPRYECAVEENAVNVTLPAAAAATTEAPSELEVRGCEIQGVFYQIGQVVEAASGPCLECRCGENGMMSCDPKSCQPQTLLKKMMIKAAERKRR